MSSVLIADDERTARKGLYFLLKSRIDEIDEAEDYEQAMQKIQAKQYDLLIIDLRFPTEQTGLKLVKKAREVSNLSPVLVITAFGSLDNAVQAMKAGAQDYVTKDFSQDELLLKIDKLLETRNLWLDNLRLANQVSDLKKQFLKGNNGDKIIGESEAIRSVLRTVSLVGKDNDSTVLITGESGTGKELIAHSIHRNSPQRKHKPFVVVDIANVPPTLLESQLFGHERGAFTNAYQQHKGLFEQAGGGTVFLDEIGDFPLELQTKLLRFIQAKTYSRVGSSESSYADVRIIAATNRNLEEMVQQQLFREDLFYRLNVIRIHLPPLRNRKEDIPLLISYFVEQLQKQKGKNISFGDEAIRKMINYEWPGNIRQLRNTIESLIVMNPSDRIDDFEPLTGTSADQKVRTEELFESLLEMPLKDARRKLIEEFEKHFIKHHLQRSKGNISKLAAMVGETREGLSKKIKRYGLKEN